MFAEIFWTSDAPIQFVTYCYAAEKHSDQKVVNIYINAWGRY